MNDNAFDRFLLFLATEYFVPFWASLSAVNFSVRHREAIQSAARKEADDFLDAAETLYDIDFSPERQILTKESFEKHLRLDAEARADLYRLEAAYAVDPQEGKNVSFCFGLIYRAVGSPQLAHHLGLAPRTREGLTKAIEAHRQRTLDTSSVEQGWLQADGSWDRRLRALTPDLPETIFLDFLSGYQTAAALPALIENFGRVVGEPATSAGLLELGRALRKQFPEKSALDVPTAIKAYGSEAA